MRFKKGTKAAVLLYLEKQKRQPIPAECAGNILAREHRSGLVVIGWSEAASLSEAQANVRREEGGGGGGSGTQQFVYQKWPDQIFPIVNVSFSHEGPFGLGGGVQGGAGEGRGVPMVVGHSTVRLVRPSYWAALLTVSACVFTCTSSLRPFFQRVEHSVFETKTCLLTRG